MGGEYIPLPPIGEAAFYLVLPPSCPGTFSTPRFSFLELATPIDLLTAAECGVSPVVHLPGAARYFFSKSLQLRGAFLIPSPTWFEVVGAPPNLRHIVRGRYAEGRGRFFGDLARLDVLRFLYRWRTNFKVGDFTI